MFVHTQRDSVNPEKRERETERTTQRLRNICHNTLKFMSSGDYVSVFFVH